MKSKKKIQHARKVRAEKEEKEFKQRQFRSDWSNASAHFNKEQSKIIIFRLNAFLKIIMMIFIEKERLNHCKEILFLILIT